MVMIKKSVEEAKQEHVDKVGELLKWVSEKSKCLAKRRLASPAAEPGEVEKSLSENQVLCVELSNKKDEIAEAIHTTQIFLAKHSDKISEEDKQQTEKQLESLHEAYDKLCEESSDGLQQMQSTLAEEAVEKDYETIAGVLDLATGMVCPIFSAICRGLIDYDTGVILLEAQVIVSGLILPETRQCLGIEEALRCQLIDGKIFNHLEELSNSAKIISSGTHPVVGVYDSNVISEISVIKVLEAWFATGGLRVPATGERFNLEEAFQRELIPAQLYFKLQERQKMCKELIDPNTAEKVSLMELMQRVTVDKETGLRLLRVNQREWGTINLKSGRQISVLRAVHEGLIDREVMIRLLGAQLFAGGLIHPQTGAQLTVDEALKCGLIDHNTASGLLTHQIQTGGVIDTATGRRLTMDEAVQCNLISSSSALLVLESQRVFMGLIWPDSGEIFSVDTSLQQGVVTNELAHKILNNRQKIAALYIPESSSVLTPEEASSLGIVDTNEAHVLNTVTLPDLMPGAKHFQSSHEDIMNWGSNSEVKTCATNDPTGVKERGGDENSTRQQMEIQKKFVSYLMMHSYMDAGSGRRLLLVNSDLNEKIKMVMEASGTDIPLENQQEYLHIQDDSVLENLLEAVKTSEDISSLKNHLHSERLDSDDRMEKQSVDAPNEHCRNINNEALCWMPGVRQFPTSELNEYGYSQTIESPRNCVTDIKESKAIQAIEALDNFEGCPEVSSLPENLSEHPNLNESVQLASQTNHANSFENDLGNHWRKSEEVPKDDQVTQVVVSLLQTADSFQEEEVAQTVSSTEHLPAEISLRIPTEQSSPSHEHNKFTLCPLDTDLQRDFGDALNKMLGLDTSSDMQNGDKINNGTHGFKDALVSNAEHANKTSNHVTTQQYLEASEMVESNDAGRRQDIAELSMEYQNSMADTSANSVPLESQLPIGKDGFISDQLETEAETSEDLVCGKNKIRTIEMLEDIADLHEMGDFVGTSDEERLSENAKTNVIMKTKDEEQLLTDDKNSVVADKDKLEDSNLENQASFHKLIETHADFPMETVFEVMSSSVEECLSVSNEILDLSPADIGSKGAHSANDTEGRKESEQKVIKIIETLDDLADLDKMEIAEESVVRDSLLDDESPNSNEEGNNDKVLANGLSGPTNTVEDGAIYQYASVGDEVENGRTKFITSVEGLDDIADSQEMPWFIEDLTGMEGSQMFSPSGVENIKDVFEYSTQMVSGEVNFLNNAKFNSNTSEQDQHKQVNIEAVQEAMKNCGISEQNTSVGNLIIMDKVKSDCSLDVRCPLQESPHDGVVTLENAEGICRGNGRHLYILEEEDEENDADKISSEAVGSRKWDRSTLMKHYKSELETGGIFDAVTGKNYSLEAALAHGLLDEEMAVDVLVSQFQGGGICFEESGENLTLSDAVAKGLLPSDVAIKVLDKLGLIGGFYNPGTGEIMEVSATAEQVVNNDLLTKVLLSEKMVSGIIDPETKKLHNVHDALRLGILNSCTALHLLEAQIVSGGIVDLKQEDQLSVAAASKLCLVDDETAEQLMKIEKAKNGGQVDEVTKQRALNYQFETYGILDPQTKQPLSVMEAVNNHLVERDDVLSVLRKQVVDGGIIQHKSGLRLSVANALRHGLINEDLADDLFELETSCQTSNAEKNLCSQEISQCLHFPVAIEKNQKINEDFIEFKNGKSVIQVESGDEKLSNNNLNKEINHYKSQDNFGESQTSIIPYSDLVRISKIDIVTGRRYLAVKPHERFLNVEDVEPVSTLRVADLDLASALKEDKEDKTLICAREDEITDQDVGANSELNCQINPSLSGSSVPESVQDISLNVEFQGQTGQTPEENLSRKLDYRPSKSPCIEDSLQGDFFSYIRECTSDIELETDTSESAGKENLVTCEEELNEEFGKLTAKMFMEEKCVEEMEPNNSPANIMVQGLMSAKENGDLKESFEGRKPDIILSPDDKAQLNGISKKSNQVAQSSGCEEGAEGSEQTVNIGMAVGNVLKAVYMKFNDAFKRKPSEDEEIPSDAPMINEREQNKKVVETLNDPAELVNKVNKMEKTVANPSEAGGNDGEMSDYGGEKSLGESENHSCQERINEEMRDQNFEGGQKLEMSLDKTINNSLWLEDKGNLVLDEESPVHSEKMLGLTTVEDDSSENTDDQRTVRINGGTDDSKKADTFDLKERSRKMEGGAAMPNAQDVANLSGDTWAAVSKSEILFDCLKRELLNEKFSESFGLKEEKSLKIAESIACLKPVMMSAHVQEMLFALIEEKDPYSLKNQALVSSLIDELFCEIKHEIPDLTEDRQVKETLCERFLVLLSTAGTPQSILQETVKEKRTDMNQATQVKENDQSVACHENGNLGSPIRGSESQEGIEKVAINDSASKDAHINDDDGTMKRMIGIKQNRQKDDPLMQSADFSDEVKLFEDAQPKVILEDASDDIGINNNKGLGEVKEVLQVRQDGKYVSENGKKKVPADSQPDLANNIHEHTTELAVNNSCVKVNEEDNAKEKTQVQGGQNINEDKNENLPMQSFYSDQEFWKNIQESESLGDASNNVWTTNIINERGVQSSVHSTNERTSEDSVATSFSNPVEIEAVIGNIQEPFTFEDASWINENKDDVKDIIETVARDQDVNGKSSKDLVMQSSDVSCEMKLLEGIEEETNIKLEQHVDHKTVEEDGQICNIAQQCLEHAENLQAHLMLLQDRRIQLESLQPVDTDLEILQEQLDYHKLVKCELEESVTRDLKAAEKFLDSVHLDPDEPLQKNLETDCKDLQTSLRDMIDVCASRVEALSSAIEIEQSKIKAMHQELLTTLDHLSTHIQENATALETLFPDMSSDLETDLEKTLTDLKIQLDTTAFDIQFFVSEHAVDFSPQENRKLLKHLNSTQTLFKSVMERLTVQVEALNLQLQTRLELDDQKAFEEKQGECNKKLQEMCDLLMVTENKIIGYESGMSITDDSLANLQQHQMEHQALQKEIEANAAILANVVNATEQFLEKNRDKLKPEERDAMDRKLKDTKSKLNQLSEQVDSKLKNLDNAVTTALKQETEKAAVVEQLKENESKIQGLLGWLSNIGQEPMSEQKIKETLQQNGNTIFVDGLKSLENEDTVNGNLPQDLSETKVDKAMEPTTDGDLNLQYQRAKLHHQQVMSQQQSYIISTQSVQDFLKKQGSSISAEEREKLEKDLNELKVQYETTLAQSETRLKLIQTVQDELQKFSSDYSEFENWLHQSKQQLEDLQTGATEVETLVGKLQRQKSFSDDVISHKGDLRYITISGQRVLDAAKSCGKLDLGKEIKPCIDTSATCDLVQRQLDVASDSYKSLHSKCNSLGKNLKDVVDKYSQYQEISTGFLPWLQDTEEAAKIQLTEAIAADPKNLQKQLKQVKALQDQLSGYQSTVEKLRKTVDALMNTEGNLLLNRDEIKDDVDDVVLRFENLSKSTSDRNEKLRMTLTRSLSVQDGLDEMLEWMDSVEKSLEDDEEMPLNSAAIQEAFSKNAVLEQNIASRQSSISAIKEKANKFIATADPTTASALQAKVDELAKRFSSARGRHKERTAKLEKLRAKVELFEKTYQKIEQFVTKKSLSLPESDGPGKDVAELSQYMQEMKAELLDQSKDLNTLNQLAEELGGCATDKERTRILNSVNALSKHFQELGEATKKREEELFCCQLQTDQFKALLMSFNKWAEGMNTRIPIVDPSLTTEALQKHLSSIQGMLNEWSSKASELVEVNQKGSTLCHLINTLTSPAYSRTIFKSGTQVVNGGGAVSAICDSKELIAIQQNIADVNHQYEKMGSLLKDKENQLETMLAQRQEIQEEANLVKEWLESMDKRAASWDTLPTETESIKEQVEQQKIFEAELNQNTGKVGQVKERLALLLEENTDAPEAGKWRQMLDYINSKWQQISQSAADRQQKLEESSSFLTQFEMAEVQLRQWLIEKELMMNVLGPLSIDPHMLNNQKQQVQILLKEFETRKPQHEQLKTAADGILRQSDDPAVASGVVSNQLATVTQKWDNLTGQLVDRSNLIDQAIDKSSRYQSLVRDLSARLNILETKLADQPAIGSQPEAVKSQLEAASEIRSELEQEEKSVQEAQRICEEISALVGEQYLKAELSRQLDNVLKPYRDLEERAGNQVRQLQSALANSEQFQQMFDDFKAWMDGKCSEQDQRPPVSAKLERLHLLIDEQAEFQKSLSQKAGSYEMILVEGEALLQNMQPSAEKTALQGRLGTLRADWEELAKQVEARQEKLRDCSQKAEKYRECVEHLLPWIQEFEEKASQVQVCSNAAEIESSLANIKGLQNDVDKHRRAIDSLNNAADSLVEASEADQQDIQSEKASVNQKVDLINKQLHLKVSSLDEMAKCMKEFQNSLKDAKKQIDGAKQQLELHDALGPQAYTNKYLTNINAQQKGLQALTSQVENVKCLAQRLAAATSDSAGTSLILQQANSLQDDYASVSQKVHERCSFLETKLQGIGQFQNTIREMFSLFADLDDELDSMAPVGRDLICLQAQKTGTQGFIIKLQELTTSIEGAKKEGKQMLESASSPDLLGLKRDLDALSKQCNKLLDRAMIRKEQVETNLARVEEFNSKCETFSKLMTVAEEHEESQGSVGTETDVINQQLESFKVCVLSQSIHWFLSQLVVQFIVGSFGIMVSWDP
ncbi:hypothetical protein chiPu_0007335 [Chiloscyllium punctatum]|uniref:Dystonin n=1 Tax=Chiloscyllium punctatum TaxID=137246 RepID=A0A401SEU0_CHIPU|nr:hypothetical protein [Chiloscyllium punctatum]